MTERASIFQTVQFGVEVTPGTGVAANRKLPSLMVSPGVGIDIKKYRATGHKYATVVVPGKEWTKAGLSGPVTYNELVYLLSGVAAYAAPVQQGATAAYLWTHTPDLDAADTIKTFTVEQGSAERAHKFAYGLINDLELAFSRDGIELSGAMLGQALQDGITMTAAPTEIALKPVLPTDVDVKLADTQAGLAGAAALTRALRASWGLRNRFVGVYPLLSTSTGFVVHVEVEPELVCKLTHAADATGMGLLTQMRAGSTKFMQIKATGELIAAPYYYDLQIEASLKVLNVSEFKDEDGLYAIEWEFVGAYDATWTKTTEIQVINTMTAL